MVKLLIDIRKNSALMKNERLGVSFISSCFIHVGVILLASIMLQNSYLRRQDFFPIMLVDVPSASKEFRTARLPETKKAPTPPEVEKIKEPKAIVKNAIVQPAPQAPPVAIAAKEELAKPIETKPSLPAKSENTSNTVPTARVEGGGSEAGPGNLFGRGDLAVVPGKGTAGGGATAASGLGRGSGAPGLPAQTAILKTNREAKPLQTVRASYPPMALRMGMEGDVAIRIDVDPEGKVTKAEIIKSAGAGFDEEALKAVKQSRFEPAQKDGQSVPAEFTYIYRFRLR